MNTTKLISHTKIIPSYLIIKLFFLKGWLASSMAQADPCEMQADILKSEL